MPNRAPTITDVAHKAGVSIATVSRVLNNPASVLPATAERVQNTIQELNYTPHSAARILATRRTSTIGLLLPDISGAFFSPLLRGIEASARQEGYDLLIHSTGGIEQGRKPRRALGEHNTDGLLIFIDSLDIQELTRLKQIGFPVVLLYQPSPDGLDLPSITIENKNGSSKLVDHLIKVHNRRRIAFLKGPPTHTDSAWRERGYREALDANGISYDPRLIEEGGFDEQVAYHAVQRMLEGNLDFDGVFSADDDSASGVLHALHDAGRKVPQEISVVGFDDSTFAPYLTPPLTTVHAPTEQVGREAVSQLVRLIHKGETAPLTLLPTEIVLRHSCGCG